MEETKQDIVTYKFHELIVHQNKLSLSLCDFFEITDFDPSQFFDSSFWCALNSLEDDEWFEVSDDVIEIIGYKGSGARKDNIRNNLFSFVKRCFIENIDYNFTLFRKSGISGSGGHTKNTLKMKRDSFKMLLLTANTQNSKDIYRYLIAFENNVKQYAIYQHECQMYQKENEVTRLKALTDVPTLDAYRKNALTINKQKRTVYVFTSKRYASLDLYKIGISFCPKKRKNGINTTHVLPDDEFYEVHSVECYDADLVEKYVHDSLDQYRYRKEREFFLLPLHLIKTVIDNTASLFNDCYERINDAIEKWNYSTETAVINTNDTSYQSDTKTEHAINDTNATCTDIEPMYEQHELPVLQTLETQNALTVLKNTNNTNTCTTDLYTQLQHVCRTTGLSIEYIKRASNLIDTVEKIQTYPELHNTFGIRNIERENVEFIRKLARCYGVHNTNKNQSKQELIDKIIDSYKCLSQLSVS